ncbi:hypothetical protein [Streptomyces sp. SH5]|uniref:hypothetical protein n=1 Tax=Streptomyces sp. SH5 TaxID=3041765 RepID=UPI0024782A43|nr:hypothetical protein [Streptomyces sp. SH5]WGP10217.1 hypothetical protein QFA72_11230 [Streptomyces sp. SH5]
MSDDQPVVLEGIPVFTGDLALLDATVKELTKDGAKIATAAGDIHSSFGGLQAFYQAPEADQLFATTKPVADRGAALKSDLATITGALGTYSDEAYPLVEKLRQLKRDAGAFLVKVNADDKWREDGDLVEENNHRRDEIRETWAAFQAVERACYNKIIAMVPGGKPLTTNDGSNGKHMYGYDAEALKQAKGLPWGDPVKESTRWYQFYEHVWDFGKGFVVDGVWGTVKGLGTLFGTEGWDTAKQAWTGLGNLATGVILTVAAPHALWLTPEKDLPGFARDARNAMKETGKALIAYDQWGENPARAGGAVTFNVLTTVFTGGAGGGAWGAGKAAAAAKALSFANKASRVVDPTTYLFKGAGAGLTKISNVMDGLKGMGRVEIPNLPPGAITLPDGAFKLGDGTLHLPEGAALPEGAFEIPKGSVRLPAGAEIPTGAVDLGDGIVHLPEGITPPAGSLPIQEGTLKLPEGTTALPEGTFRDIDAEGNVVHLDRQGNILGEDGTLKQHHTAAHRENPPTSAPARTDTDTPLPRTPAEQSALVGAGARSGSDTVRLGSDLGDTGRIGDDLGRTGDGATNPDRAPGGTANNMPTNSADNGTPGGGPRGGQDGHAPANNLDGGGPTGAGGRDVGGTGTNTLDGGTAPHGDANTTGSDGGGSGSPHQADSGDHDAPGGSDAGSPDNTPNSSPGGVGDEPMDPKVVDERIKELDDRQGGQGHAPGRHLHPDDQALTDRLGSVLRDSNGAPKLYGPNSNYPGLVKSENNIDPLTSTTVDGVTGRAHRVGAFATRFDNAEDMVRADAYFRAEMARTGEEAVETSIADVLGPGAEGRFTGYYRDPANLNEFKPVDFEGGTIMPVYRQLPDGTYRLHTMFANPAPGRHP